VSNYKEDELLNSWIGEVLNILGFGMQSETTLPDSGGYNDRLLFGSETERREAAERALDGGSEVLYGSDSVVLEAKQWDADFTKRFDEQRSYRDASHQIKYYLEHTPNSSSGVFSPTARSGDSTELMTTRPKSPTRLTCRNCWNPVS